MRKWGYAALALIVVMSCWQDRPASADDYLLTQEIQLIDCTQTETSGSGGTTTSTDCEGTTAPTVDPVQTTDTTPVITGTYDAANTHTLRVMFRGVWYVLGQNPELTASGNRWRLDLSNLSPPLERGSYSVTVEVITTGNQLLRDVSSNEVTIRVIVTPPKSDTSLPPTGQNLTAITIISCLMIAASLLLLRRT